MPASAAGLHVKRNSSDQQQCSSLASADIVPSNTTFGPGVWAKLGGAPSAWQDTASAERSTLKPDLRTGIGALVQPQLRPGGWAALGLMDLPQGRLEYPHRDLKYGPLSCGSCFNGLRRVD